jgi:hypothetical protein
LAALECSEVLLLFMSLFLQLQLSFLLLLRLFLFFNVVVADSGFNIVHMIVVARHVVDAVASIGFVVAAATVVIAIPAAVIGVDVALSEGFTVVHVVVDNTTIADVLVPTVVIRVVFD